ncbi:MAG: NAD-dependent epimerase/dehydratase family protein [Bryobacteraceae bacterium]
MEKSLDILILGCGYTGQRVAKRLLSKGARVTITSRAPEKLAALGATAITITELTGHLRPGVRVLHSIPPEGSGNVLDALHGKATRVVYLSSTAVYGMKTTVNEHTPVDASTESARSRLSAEQEITQGPWSTLVLRPAAIYGPGRGVQESIQRGEHSLSDRFVSRIHVDDLATHAEAALLSSLTGAFPVADEEPCTSREIAEFCARLLNIPVTGTPGLAEAASGQAYAGRSPRFANNRQVDGSAIRKALNITLQYPSYRFGVPASLTCI